MHSDRPPIRGCIECDHQGWVHSETPFEIQRHDGCATFPTDELAKKAHAATCGCDWPPTDFQADFRAWVGFHHDAFPQELWDDLEQLLNLANERREFVDNLDELMRRMGQLLRRIVFEIPRRPKQSYWLDNLRGAAGILLQVKYLVDSGQWESHWLLEQEDGMYDDKTGRWHAPSPPGGSHGQG